MTGAEIYIRDRYPESKCRRWSGSLGRFQVRIADKQGKFTVVLAQGKTKAAAWFQAYRSVWGAAER